MESKAGLEVFHILKRIGKHMLDNRATGLEALTYLTFLCYRGAQSSTAIVAPESSLTDALKTINSLSRFTASDDIEEDLHELEDLSVHASLCRDDYVHALHMVLTKENDCFPLYDERERHFFTGTKYNNSYSSLLRVLDSLPSEKKGTVLDLFPRFIPFFYSFDPFQHFVMLEKDTVRRAYFILRKELEGAPWNHVTILDDFPKDETFDCVLSYADDSLSRQPHMLRDHREYHFRYIIDALKAVRLGDNAVVLLTVETGMLVNGSFQSSLMRMDGFYLEKVLRLGTTQYIYYPVLFLKKGLAINPSVTFISLRRAEWDGDRTSMEDILGACRLTEGAYTTTVPVGEIREGTLSPDFYLMRREIWRKNGYLSLSDISLSGGIERWDKSIFTKEDMALTVRGFENDFSLAAIAPETQKAIYLNFGRVLTKSAILLYSAPDSERTSNLICAARIDIEKDQRIHIPSYIIPVFIDQERFDSRFVLMKILQQVPNFNNVVRLYHYNENSPAILDLILIPDIPIEEQRKAVEEYLDGVKERLPGSSRDSAATVSYNLLVVAPDEKTFKDRFGEKLKEGHLNIVDYASDSKSLEEVLPKHFGKDVPVSQRVDAILADVSNPVGDTNFILFKIHNLDVRKFYYSVDAYTPGCIHDIFMEEVKSGLIEGGDPVSGMRRILDAQMSPAAKIREEYKEFFQAAGRLDQIYPDWRLVDTVTGFLLAGKTKTPVNNVRSLLSETLCRFFRNNHVVPWCMDDGAIPSFLADGSYYDKNSRLQFKVSDDTDGKTLKSEAWLRYAFVTLFKLGNKESHVSKETKEMVSEAALIILMQVIIWFESVHDRYAEGKAGFKCFRKDRECDLKTVREVSPGYFAVGDVHIGNQDGLGDGTVGILDEQLPLEKTPRTINGVTFVRYADKGRFHIVII